MGRKEEEQEQDAEMEELVVDYYADEPMEEDGKNSNNKWKYREDPGFMEAYLKVMQLVEEDDRIEDEESAAAAEAAKPGRKRAHARKAGELDDVETTKRYKCNYWADDDPAYRGKRRLENAGQLLARTAALMNRAERETAAMMARWELEDSQLINT
uniref:Uncharacterized protein n=1 Tax=Oryza glumipatula TaxID=40148 RepID=A0A0E0ADL0_9ORYZ